MKILLYYLTSFDNKSIATAGKKRTLRPRVKHKKENLKKIENDN